MRLSRIERQSSIISQAMLKDFVAIEAVLIDISPSA